MGSVLASLRAWSAATLSVVLGTIGGVVGVVLFAVTEDWVSVPLGAVVGLYIASWVAYHNLSDKLKEAINQRFPRLKFVRVEVHIVSLFERNGPEVGKCGTYVLVLENDPEEPRPDAVARDVVARLDFYTGGNLAFSMDGRWDETDQPGRMEPFVPTIELNSVNIGIGATRKLAVMAAFPDEKVFGFNNESYKYDMRLSAYELTAEEYTVVVRIRGQRVDAQGTFRIVGVAAKRMLTPVDWNSRYNAGESKIAI